jgi:hypothetical protein
MTVEVETSRVVYVGDGDTGPFSIPFYFIADADIKAIKVLIADGTETVLVLNTDFTLDGAGDEAGGTLTLTASIDSTYRLVIYRDPAALQETAYPANDPFPSASHERVADLLTMIVQRVLSLVERSMRQPDGDADDISALPAKASRASKYLAFDADGDPIATAGTTEENPVSVFVATLLDDADGDAFWNTLEADISDWDLLLQDVFDGVTAETAPAVGDLILLSDVSLTPDDGRKMTLENMLKVVNGLTEDTDPDATADFLLTYDATASGVKKVKLHNASRVLPQNSQSADYTLVLADAGKDILHPAADTNNRTFTIPANASVAFPVGTVISFSNEANTVTIAITSDTLTLAGAGSTGSRTLAADGVATIKKITTTKWMISGVGLT